MSSQTLEPIKLDRSTIVRAGAGAGKTTALTEHVLNVAREFHKIQERYPRIVVTTFTKKATQELKERLVLLALQKDNELLEFVNSSSVLKISTIHGILDQYLRQYGSFLALDPSFTVINSSVASQLARQVIRRILLNHEEKDVLQGLIDDFSFKKLEKLCRDYYRVKLQYPKLEPHDQLSLEKLNKDYIASLVRDIESLVESIQMEESNPKWVAYAEHMLNLGRELKNREWNESFDFLKNLFEQTPTATKSKNIQITDETNEFKKDLTAQIKDLFEDECYHPSSYQLFSDKFLICKKLFDAFADQFLQVKLQAASVEINDLELLSLKLSRDFGDTAKAFSDEWDYWLIDEYQDTSPVQVELIEKLSQGKPQYVVGDPQQSIYLFRGARSEVFQSREREILSREGVKLEKIKNYRSQPELLEFFNDFFKKFRIPFSPMIANWSEPAENTQKLVAKFYIADKSDEVEDDELLAIAEHIEKLAQEKIKFEDICILARTNKNLNEISKVLTRFGLPNHVHAASGFYQRREVQDALAIYKFLVHPHNNLNLMILLRSPWFLVDEQFLVDHLPKAKDSFWIYLSQFKDQLSGIQKLTTCLERVQSLGIGSCFLETLLSCGIFDFSQANHESNLWKLVSLLREQEQKAGFNPLDLIAQIESDIRADQDSEGDAVTVVEPERVNLMTIHASKGLQFRHVIVARMNKRPKAPHEPDFLFDENLELWSLKIPMGAEEKFTSSVAEKNHVEKMKKSEIAEHARVLYVAMTRAIDSVFLSWTDKGEKNSWTDMIRWDLSPGIHRSEHYSYEVITGKPQPNMWQSTKASELIVRKPFESIDPERAKNLSVTSLLEKGGTQKSTKEPNQWLDHFKIVSHGSLTHKLMQALKYSSNVDALIERWFKTQRQEVRKALSYMQGLDFPPLVRLIEEGHVEMGFSYREGEQIIDGQIDLWGIVDDVVWIIDYKTGSIRYKDKAFSQLEYYAKALKKSGMIKAEQKIQLSVIYPFSEKLFNQTYSTS